MKQTVRIREKESGFSLIELLVIIVIIAILAAIAIPGFSGWLPNWRLKQATRDVYSNLQRAKVGAIKSNENWGVFFDEANSRYELYSLGADGLWGGGDDQLQNLTINLSKYQGVGFGHGNATKDIDDNPFGAGDDISHASPDDVVVFTSRGTVNNPGGYVYLSNFKNVTYCVGTPSPAGVIHMKKWNDTTDVWE
jgi:prepilin-type N-terminal cleavage/methylation domain-containing protein